MAESRRLPSRIFGQPFENITIRQMRRILDNYRIIQSVGPVSDHALFLSHRLWHLEHVLTESKKKAIRHWLRANPEGGINNGRLPKPHSRIRLGGLPWTPAEQVFNWRRLPLQRECIVCMERHFPTAFPDGPPSASCQHASDTCLDCLHRSVATQLTDKGFDQIVCPSCPSVLEYEDVQKSASSDAFER